MEEKELEYSHTRDKDHLLAEGATPDSEELSFSF